MFSIVFSPGVILTGHRSLETREERTEDEKVAVGDFNHLSHAH